MNSTETAAASSNNYAQELKALKDDLAALRKNQEEAKQTDPVKEQQRLKAQEQEVIQGYRKQVAEKVKAAGEKYELINHFGHHDLVFQIINDHAEDQQGIPLEQVRLLSIEAAADALEAKLAHYAQELTSLYESRPRTRKAIGSDGLAWYRQAVDFLEKYEELFPEAVVSILQALVLNGLDIDAVCYDVSRAAKVLRELDQVGHLYRESVRCADVYRMIRRLEYLRS